MLHLKGEFMIIIVILFLHSPGASIFLDSSLLIALFRYITQTAPLIKYTVLLNTDQHWHTRLYSSTYYFGKCTWIEEARVSVVIGGTLNNVYSCSFVCAFLEDVYIQSLSAAHLEMKNCSIAERTNKQGAMTSHVC